MKLTVHGCRGSVPTPSPYTAKYGGHTTCFELRFNGYQIIFDTGSGFQNLILADSAVEKLILYSHFHHDHIQGLPFNADLFDHDHSITISSALASGYHLRQTLKSYFSKEYFPIDMVSKLSHVLFADISLVKAWAKPDFHLEWIALEHPGGCFGYRISHGQKMFCYLCDNEFHDTQLDAIMDFIKGADMVIWDGMFTGQELADKTGWGHSSIEQGIVVFNNSDISAMIITHRAPLRLYHMLDDLQSLLPEGVQFAKDQLSVLI